MKADTAARNALGAIYDETPKSAFALIAYHLANLCADEPDNHRAVMTRLLEEAEALASNGIMPEQHARKFRAALAKATGGRS